MEPGEKSALLGAHSHGNLDPHLQTSPSTGFFSSMSGKIRNRLGIKAKPPQKLQPVSAVESMRALPTPGSRPTSMVSEYELQEGHERTRKHYAKLANRRSVL
jgi:hypothetical protein